MSITQALVRETVLALQYEAATSRKKRVDPAVSRAAFKNHGINSCCHRSIVIADQRSNYWDWSSHKNTTHINNYYPEANKADKGSHAKTAAIVGTLLTVVCAGFAGFFHSTRSTQQESVSQMKGLNDVIYNGDVTEVQPGVLRLFARLVNVQLSIDELKLRKINDYFHAFVGGLIGGATLAVGGFLVMDGLMAAGAVTLVFFAALGLWNVGTHWNDDSKIAKYQNMILGHQGNKGLADAVLEKLAASEQSASLPRYESLVPETYAPQGAISAEVPPFHVPSHAINANVLQPTETLIKEAVALQPSNFIGMVDGDVVGPTFQPYGKP